ERIGMLSWIDDDFDYATLYTDEEVWRFRRSRTPDRWDSKLPSQGGGWELREDVDNPQRNPLGLMPLVEFRNETLLDDVPVSDIGGVICMQDAINLTWAYLLNALDYASLPGRVVLGTAPPEIPILDQSGQPTGKTRPLPLDEFIRDRIAFIPGENTSIGEWSVATLDGFSKVIEQAVEHIAAQTRTPPPKQVARMVNTDAESLTIAEAGLVSKTRERIRMAKAPLRRIFRLMALAMGDEAKAEQC